MDKRNITFGVLGVVVGIVLMGLVGFSMAPGLMILENESRYGFDKSVEVLKESVEKNGWKIPKIHDLQKTMEKFGKNVAKVQVFEICHPDHAYKILSEDEERVVASLMPCRIAVYERQDGKTYISRMNSGLMGKMMSGVIPEVMGAASRESEEIVEPLIKL